MSHRLDASLNMLLHNRSGCPVARPGAVFVRGLCCRGAFPRSRVTGVPCIGVRSSGLDSALIVMVAEYLAASYVKGLFAHAVTDDVVSPRWTLSGAPWPPRGRRPHGARGHRRRPIKSSTRFADVTLPRLCCKGFPRNAHVCAPAGPKTWLGDAHSSGGETRPVGRVALRTLAVGGATAAEMRPDAVRTVFLNEPCLGTLANPEETRNKCRRNVGTLRIFVATLPRRCHPTWRPGWQGS